MLGAGLLFLGVPIKPEYQQALSRKQHLFLYFKSFMLRKADGLQGVILHHRREI
jgi:hypothetical protein